jgi:uncharacterized repeat protein (TIGR03806 family)
MSRAPLLALFVAVALHLPLGWPFGWPVALADPGIASRPANPTCIAPPRPDAGPAFPTLLSGTGCVDPDDPTTVATGLVPYQVNTPLWSDGAAKRRWLAIPDGTSIAVGADGDFDFPNGSVLIKEFSFDEVPFETRLFVRHDDGGWAGYTYRWNASHSDAELVASGGLANQSIGAHTWSYPSRAQCLECHTAAAGRTLGLEIAQLNGSMRYPSGIVANQLETLDAIGMLTDGLGGAPETLPALAPLGAPGHSLYARARSYLHANCSNCHRPSGPGQGPMDYRYDTPFPQAAMCDEYPFLSDLGVEDARILTPGSPAKSVMSLRMHALNGNRMPRLGSRVVDARGTATVDAWIGSIRNCTDARPRRAHECSDGPLPVLCTLPDLDEDGTADVATVRADPLAAELLASSDGSLIRALPFLRAKYTAAAAAVLPDTDGDAVPELAVLAVRDSDGRMVVQLRDLDGSGAPRQVWFATGYTPLALALVDGDADDNGIPELAVLSTRDSDGRGVVQVKNAAGAPNTKTLWVPAGYAPHDLEVVPDADGNGVPDLAVLARRGSDGRVLTQIANADGSGTRYPAWFGYGQTPIDLAVLPDKEADGIPEVAVLSSRAGDGRLFVQVRNASGAANPASFWLGTGYTGIALAAIAPVDGSLRPEIGVLSQRRSDGRILVSVRNAAGADTPRSIWYTVGYGARGLATFDDVDDNGIEEPAVLMTRDSDGKSLAQSRNAWGTPAPRNYTFAE